MMHRSLTKVLSCVLCKTWSIRLHAQCDWQSLQSLGADPPYPPA